MAALSADVIVNEAIGEEISYPVKAATSIYKGAMVSVQNGYAEPMADTYRFDGIAMYQAINTTAAGVGSAGQISVQVRRKIKRRVYLDNVNKYMIGAYVYAVNDNDVTLVPMSSPVGRVIQIDGEATDYAIVEFDADLNRKTMDAMGIFEPFRLPPFSLPASAATVLGDILNGTPWKQTVVDGGGDLARSINAKSLALGSFYHNGLELLTDNAENDGINLLMSGKAFYLSVTTKPLFFGTRIKINDATQTDFCIGLVIPDTALLGGMTDGIYLEKSDAALTVTCVVEKDSTETTSGTIATMADDTWVSLGFVYDGTYVYPYVDGVAGTALAVTNLPNDELLTPGIEFLTGETTANILSMGFLDAYQLV